MVQKRVVCLVIALALVSVLVVILAVPALAQFSAGSGGTGAPVADFTGTFTYGSAPPAMPAARCSTRFACLRPSTAPVTVTFADLSTGNIAIRTWQYKPASESAWVTFVPDEKHAFTFANTGTYDVRLTVTGPGGSTTKTRTQYVTVPESRSHAGVALTFDDAYVDDWYAIRPLLAAHNAHATFFTTGISHLTEEQIDKLKQLQSDGNEIGLHGANHLDAADYLKTHSIDEYLNTEIIPDITFMKNKGLNPVDFTYPYGSDDPALTRELESYFTHIRDTAYELDPAVYQYGSNQPFISGIGIDKLYGFSDEDIYKALERAKTEDSIIIFYGHQPVTDNPSDYQTSYDRILKILQYVSENNMKTYTISEIH